MLSLAIATAFGFWLNQNAGFFRSEVGTLNFEVDARAIAADVVALWTVLLSICAFAVNTGRNARTFTDSVALPWFAAFGLSVPSLPTLPQVPTLPTQDRLTA